MIVFIIVNLFFSPVVVGLLEGKCTKAVILNVFLWVLGVIPGMLIDSGI